MLVVIITICLLNQEMITIPDKTHVVIVGKRTLASLTKEEFGHFLYEHGYCASKEYWCPPEFSEFEYHTIRPEGSIHFKYTQTGCAGQNYTINRVGIVSGFNNDPLFSYHENNPNVKGSVELFYFKVSDIRYFLKLGFDFKLY